MANYQEIIPFIRKVEGGLSKAKTDSASADPVPDGSGYHTNKGVTWKTFKSFQTRLGVKSTGELIKLFYTMPDNVWVKIFKTGYWDPINGDKIKSQAFADTLVDWAYAAGPGRAIQKTQEFFKVPQTKKMDEKTIQTINSIVDEAELVKKFSDYKKRWYLALPNQSANYKGWESRLNQLYATVSKKIFTKVKENPVLIAVGLVGVTAAIYFIVKSSKKKDQVKLAA